MVGEILNHPEVTTLNEKEAFNTPHDESAFELKVEVLEEYAVEPDEIVKLTDLLLLNADQLTG